MLVKLPVDAAKKMLAGVAKATDSRVANNVLANVLIAADKATGRVVLTATDYDLEAQAEVRCGVARSGSCLINAKLLAQIIAVSSGELDLDSPDGSDNTTIRCGRAQYVVQGESATHFPAVEMLDAEADMVLPMDSIRRALAVTLPFVSHDESRPAINGVLLTCDDGVLEAWATDGHRMGHYHEPDVDLPDMHTTLPPTMAAELARADAAKIAVVGHRMLADFGSHRWCARLTDAVFPETRRVFESALGGSEVVVQRTDLVECLRRVALSAGKVSMVRALVTADSIRLEQENDGRYQTSDECACEGDLAKPIKIGLNAGYMREALDALGGDRVSIRLADEFMPMLLRVVGDDCASHVLMPMRL